MNHRIRRKEQLPQVDTGRIFGVAYANIIDKNRVQKTVFGITPQHASRRANRVLGTRYPFV